MSAVPLDWNRRLAAAMQHHQAGQFPQAIALYQELVTQAPENADALHLLGMALDQAGHPAQGKPAIEFAVRMAPDVAAYRITLGNACRALNDMDGATAAYAEALRLQPDAGEAHNGLGLLAQSRQDWAAARRHFRTAAEVGLADACLNLAVTEWLAGNLDTAVTAFESLLVAQPAYLPHVVQLARRTLADKDETKAAMLVDLLARISSPVADRLVLQGGIAMLKGDRTGAEQFYRAALESEPQNSDALRLLSHILLERQDFAEALPLLERAHALQPGDLAIFSALGVALVRTAAFERAIQVLQQVVAHSPDNLAAWIDLAYAHLKSFQFENALPALRRVAELEPGKAAHHANLANYLIQTGNLDEAEAALQTAAAIDPDAVVTLGNLANLRDLRGQPGEAEALYLRVLARDPEDATSHTNLALLRMRQGRYAEGWPHYVWRSKGRDWSSPDRSQGLPRWDGAMPPPGRLLAWREQGVGDEILYAAVLPELAARGVDLVQATDPRLVPLFARSFPTIKVVPDDDTLDVGGFGLVCQRPLADLAALCRPDLASLANHPRAYLKADPARSAQLRQRYQAQGKKLLIGVSWSSGNPRTGRNKSVSLHDMLPLLREPDATYVSLQYGRAAADVARLAADTDVQVLHDAEIDPLADIDAQAAQIAGLDLVISVSTATAHLAAALGVPTLILLRQDWGQLWYWGHEGERTPWYPVVRLCRAPRGMAGADLARQASGMLQEMLATLR